MQEEPKLEIIVNIEKVEVSLRDYLKSSGISSSLIKELKYVQGLLINDVVSMSNSPVHNGDKITLLLNAANRETDLEPVPMIIKIIYEDQYLIAIDKPANTVVHPAGEHINDSLANNLAYYFKQREIKTKIRPVSRLDKDTTGIIIFAKNSYTQEEMKKQQQTKTFKKFYYGIVSPIPAVAEGEIDKPIARNPDSIMLRCISPEGKKAVTKYKTIQTYSLSSSKENLALVRFQVITGRTHQIRVHCLSEGFPLIGDDLYNPDGPLNGLIDRQALHCYKVEFIHPGTRAIMKFNSPLPADMLRIINH
jgi:23S rRNA pseudouridine1911/1915/1917 synthase